MKTVHIVFYDIPTVSGRSDEGVEAFFNESEKDSFLREIKGDGGSVEIVTTTKEEILKKFKLHA